MRIVNLSGRTCKVIYTITDTSNTRLQAIFLKAHLRVLTIPSMKPPRGMTRRQLLDKAGMITGVSYKRGEYSKAATDLQTFLNNTRY